MRIVSASSGKKESSLQQRKELLTVLKARFEKHTKRHKGLEWAKVQAESPKGRRSLCYDRKALESRKEHKPRDNATDVAAAMDIELLTEEQYRELQKLGNFRYQNVELSENSAAPSFVIAATTLFSYFTTVRNLIMPRGRSAGR
jgi:uncharacterized protein DUF4256